MGQCCSECCCECCNECSREFCSECCCECCNECCCEESHSRGFSMARDYIQPTRGMNMNTCMDEEEMIPLYPRHICDDDYECPYRSVCHRFMKSLEIPESFFDDEVSKDEECYCSKCHNERGEQTSYSKGYPAKKYRLPIGWARFALQIKSEHAQDFDEWHVAFHGTASKDIDKILNSESEVIALPYSCGESASVSEYHYAINSQPTSGDDVKMFVSPSIKYSEQYANPTLFYDATTNTHHSCKVAFQVCIKPNSYEIEKRIMSNDHLKTDTEIEGTELEWSTKQVDDIMICALLVQATELNFNK